MQKLGEWLFSGEGVAVLAAIWAWLRRARRPTTRKLAALVDEVRSSSLAIEQPEAFDAIVGMQTWFNGRVVRATAADNSRVTVDFEVRRDIHARCVFERLRFPGIALLKEGQKRRVVGTIMHATRDLVEVCPLSNAS